MAYDACCHIFYIMFMNIIPFSLSQFVHHVGLKFFIDMFDLKKCNVPSTNPNFLKLMIFMTYIT